MSIAESASTTISSLLSSIVALVCYGTIAFVLLVLLLYIWLCPLPVDESVPGPKRVPFLGVTFGSESELFGGEFSWSEWPTLGLLLSRQFQFRTWGGPALNIGFGGAFFNIVSPDCLQHVLRDNFDNYQKGKVARKCLQELLGGGIFTSDGVQWKKHRKLITTLMTKDTVIYANHLLLDKLQQVEQLLLEGIDVKGMPSFRNDDETNGAIVDFQDLCYRMVLDVFVKMAFGVELDTVVKSKDDEGDSFMQAFNDLQYLCHQRFNDLLWELKQFLCWGERERLIQQKAKIIHEFADDIIRKACDEQQEAGHRDDATPPTPRRRPADLIRQCLAQAERLGEAPPSPKDIRDLVMNFVLAGRDSTAVGLSWTLYELTKHPGIADKIREEVQRVCGIGSVSYSTIDKLEYTHAVVMEALRLHSPVPDDFKFAIHDDILPDGTKIPSGSCVMYSPNCINRSDKNWGDTVDEFTPERFLNATEPSAFRYPTFNAGPRLCPGKPLALMEIKTSLAYLLPRFEFIDEQGHSGDYNWTLVMAMKGGFPIKVKRRNT